jgi:archease protein family (MTH1598/TM1083)
MIPGMSGLSFGRGGPLAGAVYQCACRLAASGNARRCARATGVNPPCIPIKYRGIVSVAVDRLRLEPASIRARVGGYRGDPPHLVKAVTYHRLTFGPSDGGWRANVVLDV